MSSFSSLSDAERGKLASAYHALSFIEDGMRVGLGTGSTAAWLVRLLGEKMRREPFRILGVPTSSSTAELAQQENIPITTLDEAGSLDVTVDGADEFDPQLRLIKGAGGALLQEKIVATASDKMIVITDPSKEVPHLGMFPLSVEVVRFGWETTQSKIQDVLEAADVMGTDVRIRMDRDVAFVTDEKHYILDLHLRRIGDPDHLAQALNMIPGVVETGLFIGIATRVVIGTPEGGARIFSGKDAAETVGLPDGVTLQDVMPGNRGA